MNKKIKIHIRNNHWKHGSLPCDPECELNSTITKEEFEKGLNKNPELRDKIEYLIIGKALSLPKKAKYFHLCTL